MPNVFDGTNPITDILGDEPTEREVTMANQSTMTIIEPLTNTSIPAGQTVLVRVIGDMAHSTLVNNIQQINALQGFEVIGLTSVVIPDEPVPDEPVPDEPVPDEPVAGDLLLVPTGATESADGDYQRFAYDGTNTIDFELQGRSYQIPIWYADLPLANRQSEYQISLKMPDLVEYGSANLYLVDADFDLDFFLSPSSLNHLLLELRPEDGSTQLSLSVYGNSELSSSIVFTQPAAGSVISLTLSTTNVDYAWDGGSGTLSIPDGFFYNPPNVVVFSSGDSASHIADLSVRFAAQ